MQSVLAEQFKELQSKAPFVFSCTKSSAVFTTSLFTTTVTQNTRFWCLVYVRLLICRPHELAVVRVNNKQISNSCFCLTEGLLFFFPSPSRQQGMRKQSFH